MIDFWCQQFESGHNDVEVNVVGILPMHCSSLPDTQQLLSVFLITTFFCASVNYINFYLLNKHFHVTFSRFR